MNEKFQVVRPGIKDRLTNAKRIFQDLSDPLKASKITDLQRLEASVALYESADLPTFVPMLPLCFNLDGHPYTLENHFPLEPVFNRTLPRVLTIKAARQLGKSTFQAARALAITTAIPYFSTLFIFPLYEQVNRFSTYYVRKFIEESPIRDLWVGQGTNNSVLTKSFKNFAKMTFSFASISAERARGIAANLLAIDELQNLDSRMLPILNETLSASSITDSRTGERRYVNLKVFTGTPKSMENALEYQWQHSSMAEFVIPCNKCKKANYACMGYDLEKMIGPMHDDIGEVLKGKRPATVCAKCGLSINPRDGFWHHRHPKLIHDNPGYHIPQIIMPMHYGSKKSWSSLLAKQAGADNYTTAKFYNEVLGESFDMGAKLVTETDLQRAAVLPWDNKPTDYRAVAIASKGKYLCKFIGVDWGGGGEKEVSFTTIAVVGLLPSGKMDVIYGRRLLMTHDALGEAEEILKVYTAFECDYLCHDYNGAGSLCEQYLIQSGLPYERVIPMVYYRSGAKDIMVFHRGAEDHHRSFYHLDKGRALMLVCEMLKLAQIRFFRYDFKDNDNRGLLRDFTSLVAGKVETARAGEVFSINRVAAFPDDFAHSVTFAACGIWHHMQKFPDLPMIARLRLTAEQHKAMNPSNPWSEE